MCQSPESADARPDRKDLPALLALIVMTGALYVPTLISGRTALDSPELIDVTTQWRPGCVFIGRCYSRGHFPLWNRTRYAGMPWLAYSHGGCLYPPNFTLLAALDFLDAVTLLHMLHALVAALGAYFLGRLLRLSRLSAFLAGICFASSGFYFYLQSQLSNHASIAYTPWLLFFALPLHREARARHFFGTALSAALMAHAGDTEGVTYSFMFTGVFVLLTGGVRDIRGLLRSAFTVSGAIVLGLAMALGLILPLAELLGYSVRSSRSLFDLQFSGFYTSWYIYMPLFLAPLDYFARLHPLAAFNNGLPPFYIGLAPLLGALFCLGPNRDRTASRVLLAGLLMFAFMLIKKVGFLQPLMEAIPVIGKLATPERAIEFLQLALLLAAGLVFDRARQDARSHWKAALALVGLAASVLAAACWSVAPALRVFAGALALAGAGWIGVLAFRRMPGLGRAFSVAVAAFVLLDVYLMALVLVPRLDKDRFMLGRNTLAYLEDRADPSERYVALEDIDASAKGANLAGLVSADTPLSSPFGHMRLPLARYFEFLHVMHPGVVKEWDGIFWGHHSGRQLFFTADLYNPRFISNRNIQLLGMLGVKYVLSRELAVPFVTDYSLLNKGAYSEDGAPVREIARLADGRPALPPVESGAFGFTTYVAPGSKLALSWARLDGPAGDGGERDGGGAIMAKFLARDYKNGKLLASWSLKAEACPDPVSGRVMYPVEVGLADLAGSLVDISVSLEGPPEGLALVDPRIVRADAPFARVRAGEVDIYENRRALAKARVLREAEALSDEAIRERLGDPAAFDPSRLLLLEEGSAPRRLIGLARRSLNMGGGDEARVVGDIGDALDIEARLSRPGWLFVADAYQPGWRAFDGDNEVRIYRANYAFRALFLPEGQHRVRFRYLPASFRVGLWFTLVSTIMAAAWFAAAAISARRG